MEMGGKYMVVAHPLPSDNKAIKSCSSAVAVADDLTSRDYYLDSDAHFSVHEQILRDNIRTNTFKSAINYNKHLFEDKIVLNVGCGTGLMCMLVAQAGAKTVIGIDKSAMADQAREIVKDNKLEDSIIIIRGDVQDVSLPVNEVDVIIAEWMGYSLYSNSMLESVIFARDKWLTKEGILFPDRGTLYVCAIEDKQFKDERINFWEDVYGFNMTCLKNISLAEPLIEAVPKSSVVSNSCLLKEIDLYTVKKDDISFDSPFCLSLKKNEHIHALVTYFEVEFSKCHKKTLLSTAPNFNNNNTMWKQTTFFLRESVYGKKGESIYGRFMMEPSKKKNSKELEFEIIIQFKGEVSSLYEYNKYRM